MELNSRSTGGVEILELAGRFDAYKAPPAVDWLDRALAQNPTRVVINLANVNFVDSTALATMVQGMKKCRQQNGDLRLCSLQQPVSIIFELTRLDKTFAIYPSESEAIGSFNN